jgi:hypothetical protein
MHFGAQLGPQGPRLHTNGGRVVGASTDDTQGFCKPGGKADNGICKSMLLANSKSVHSHLSEQLPRAPT